LSQSTLKFRKSKKTRWQSHIWYLYFDNQKTNYRIFEYCSYDYHTEDFRFYTGNYMIDMSDNLVELKRMAFDKFVEDYGLNA